MFLVSLPIFLERFRDRISHRTRRNARGREIYAAEEKPIDEHTVAFGFK